MNGNVLPDMNHRPDRMPGLDVLRFAAAFGVVVAHYGPFLHPDSPFFAQCGSFCVQLFFLISGIVILRSAEASATRKTFLYRRFLRLYPEFLIGFTISVTVALGQGGSFPLGVLLGNLTMLPRLLQIPLINGAYWTLSYEWAFYVAVAICLPWLARYLEFLILAWVILSAFLVLPLAGHPSLAILLNTHFAILFSSGMLISRYRCGQLPRDRIILFSIFIILAYAVHVLMFDAGAPFDGRATDFALFCSVLVLGLFATRISLSPAGARATLSAGKASYSLYLIHPPIFSLIYCVSKQLLLSGVEIVIVSMSLAILTAFGISHYLEAPVRRLFEPPRSRKYLV